MTTLQRPTRLAEEKLREGGSVALELLSQHGIRLRVSTCPSIRETPSYAIIRRDFPTTEYDQAVGDEGVYTFSTGDLRIFFRAEPFLLTVQDPYGNILFETIPDGLEFRGRSIRLTRRMSPRDGLYGLGEQPEVFNKNPGYYRAWSRDDPNHTGRKQYYCHIPFGISLPGGATPPHAFFLDNPGELFFDVGQADPERFTFITSTGDLDLWLFFEESPARLIEEYTELTGRMERPPLWALGYQQCRWSYRSAEVVREIAHEFRNRRLPCDVIYMDIDYMQDFRIFTWHKERFPDPPGLIGELHGMGFSPVCIVDPGISACEGYFAYEEGMKQPGFFLCGPDGKPIASKVWPASTYHPDFTNPAVRSQWGAWQTEYLTSIGIEGIWNDMNEPAVFAQHAEGMTPVDYPPVANQYDHGLYRQHRDIHNIYGLTMAQASHEGQKAARPDVRPFTLTRSGWAGIQRHSAVWTGDNTSHFLSMPMDIALILNMGMSGVPFVGCDIGGFGGVASPELFGRWMEWGALLPFSRGHSCTGTEPHEPWTFGKGTEAVCRRMLEWRYRLLPYLYTVFVETCETGLPVARSLILEHPNDETAKNIGDQFLVGSDLLVAPVLEPGKDHRCLYLPPGDWIHLWSEERHSGARWMMIEAPYGQPPIFMRAGSIIPMHPVRQHTKEPEPETMYLDVYAAPRMKGHLVEDDGRTMAYERGMETRIVFSGEGSSKGLKLLIGGPQGHYQSARSEWVVRLHGTERRVETVTCQGKTIQHEAEGRVTSFRLADNRQALEIEVVYTS